jgi:peptide/nickel transport system substrate-binding protein
MHSSIRSPARRLTVRRAGVVALSAALLAAAGASAQTAARAGSAKDIDHLTWAVPATIRGVEYTHSADAVSASVISLGCETLVQYDNLGRLKPNLAASFSTPDATTYVYKLRKGVKFWDGKPLTTADVVYSLEQAASKKNGSQIAAFYSGVKSIKATRSDTVTIRLTAPDPYFRYSPAVTYILEKAFWAKNGKKVGTPGTLTMCTGPFQFTKLVPDERVEATRFEGYWGKKPAVQSITLRFIVNDATRLLAMRSGEIDGTFQVPQDQIDQWKRVPGTTIELAPELRTGYISFDVASDPWSDIHVRRALAYALDKPAVVKAILRGYGAPAPVMPPPEQWGDLLPQAKVARLYASFPSYPFSIAKAKAELAKSRFPDGFTATLPYPDSRQTLGKVALALSQNLKSLNITLNVKQLTTDDWFNTLYTHPKPIGIQIISWGVDYPDPADALHFIYDSKYATANAFNTSNYASPAMDKLLAIQQNSVNRRVRADAIANALKLGARDVPYLPIWYQQIAMALKSKYTYDDFGTWYLYRPWALDISAK